MIDDVTFRGSFSFRQYKPSKSVKYGIKIWTICGSTSPYLLKVDMFKGKQIGEPTEANLGSKVVLKLSELLKHSRRSICNIFFINLES